MVWFEIFLSLLRLLLLLLVVLLLLMVPMTVPMMVPLMVLVMVLLFPLFSVVVAMMEETVMSERKQTLTTLLQYFLFSSRNNF